MLDVFKIRDDLISRWKKLELAMRSANSGIVAKRNHPELQKYTTEEVLSLSENSALSCACHVCGLQAADAESSHLKWVLKGKKLFCFPCYATRSKPPDETVE